MDWTGLASAALGGVAVGALAYVPQLEPALPAVCALLGAALVHFALASPGGFVAAPRLRVPSMRPTTTLWIVGRLPFGLCTVTSSPPTSL